MKTKMMAAALLGGSLSMNVNAEAIEENPAVIGNIETQFILGIAKMDDEMKILLDINKIVDSQEVDSIAQAA